jgi:hypothetical protein
MSAEKTSSYCNDFVGQSFSLPGSPAHQDPAFTMYLIMDYCASAWYRVLSFRLYLYPALEAFARLLPFPTLISCQCVLA